MLHVSSTLLLLLEQLPWNETFVLVRVVDSFESWTSLKHNNLVNVSKHIIIVNILKVLPEFELQVE